MVSTAIIYIEQARAFIAVSYFPPTSKATQASHKVIMELHSKGVFLTLAENIRQG
jgi:hypothetical protein